MLSNINDMLRDAQARRVAIASLNVYSYESIRGSLLAAQDCGMPVILAFAARYQKNLSLQQVAYLCRSCGEDISLDYALHLDHCGDVSTIQKAIDAGFSSVMYDGSQLSFDENVRNTAEVARMAHDRGVSVEAELGAIKTGLNAAEDSGTEALYTRPEEAARFIEMTSVDALAVSIGTVHGMYKGTPNIRVDILKSIRDAVHTPLVLHGGSGTGREMLRECISNGICKVNVNTEISMWCVEKLRQMLEEKPGVHLSTLSLHEIEYFREGAGQYVKLLSME